MPEWFYQGLRRAFTVPGKNSGRAGTMIPLYFTLHTHLQLIVLPDMMKHLNGHMIITDTYSIFKKEAVMHPRLQQVKESEMHRLDHDDPGYLGYLRIDIPDKLFTYIAPDHTSLHTDEVQELIELLTEMRENTSMWHL